MVRLTCFMNAFDVGGSNSNRLDFLVKRYLRALSRSVHSLVRSYIIMTKRSKIVIVAWSTTSFTAYRLTKASVASGKKFQASQADFFSLPEKLDTVSHLSSSEKQAELHTLLDQVCMQSHEQLWSEHFCLHQNESKAHQDTAWKTWNASTTTSVSTDLMGNFYIHSKQHGDSEEECACPLLPDCMG